MLRWLRRRKLSEAGRRRLLIALARAEEELLDAHVRNALDVFDAVGEELSLARALEIYLESTEVGEPRGAIIARRVMAKLEAGEQRRARSTRRARENDDG